MDAAVWACTSGSFVFGWDGAAAQVDGVAAAAGVPASSTSFAFVNAARHLGLSRVAVAATYPRDVADRFVEFLAKAEIDVVSLSCRGIITAAEVGTLGRDDVLGLRRRQRPSRRRGGARAGHRAAHRRLADDLEQRLGKPVLTANQVSVWEGLRLVARRRAPPGPGRAVRLKGSSGHE